MKQFDVTIHTKYIADEFSDVSYLIDQLKNKRVDRFEIRNKLMELINCMAVDEESPEFLVDVKEVTYDRDEVDWGKGDVEDEETGAGENT